MSMILVSHNLGVVAGRTDEILVLYGGHIVEQGKHQKLLAKGGYYHDLYSKQFAEENAAKILQ